MKRSKFPIFLITFVVAVGVFWTYKKTTQTPDESLEISPTITLTPTPTVETPTPTPTDIYYDGEKSPSGYSNFFEKLPVIDGQQGYAAIPKTIPHDDPPDIIIYYHGSTQTITTNFSTNQVMKDMREYGAYMTERNIIFLASNQHGDNWGSTQAIEDSKSLIEWVKERYPTSDNLYILGFSMGGMPALNHAVAHPKKTTKVALLAPANQVEYYSPSQIQLFEDIPLEIWHGTADVNVGYWATELLVSKFKEQNTPVTVHTLKGKVHWDVDTEYMNEVYDFFAAE